MVWVRLDLADRADELAAPTMERGYVLAPIDHRAMWLDQRDPEWGEDWLLRPVDLGSDEAVIYVEYQIVEDERTVCEGCEEPIKGEPRWHDMDAFCETCWDDLTNPERGDYGQLMPGTALVERSPVSPWPPENDPPLPPQPDPIYQPEDFG